MSKTRTESGQATVEFALILPLLIACAGIVLAVGLLARLQMHAWEIAFLAGRAATLSIDDPRREALGAIAASGHDGWSVTIIVDEPFLTTRVERRFSVDVPIIGPLTVAPVHAHVTMYYEALG